MAESKSKRKNGKKRAPQRKAPPKAPTKAEIQEAEQEVKKNKKMTYLGPDLRGGYAGRHSGRTVLRADRRVCRLSDCVCWQHSGHLDLPQPAEGTHDDHDLLHDFCGSRRVQLVLPDCQPLKPEKVGTVLCSRQQHL